MNITSDSAIRLQSLRFAWPGQAPLLHIEHLSVRRGERLFLQGASGSGKSTLLGLIGGVLGASAGAIDIFGQPLATLAGAQRDRFRAAHIGFVFQMFNLLPYLSVLDNILLPLSFSPPRRAQVRDTGATEAEQAQQLLAALGLHDPAMLGRTPAQLSQGQQQRVAVARALIGRPPLLIADEPTSALDADARGAFLELLLGECTAAGTTVVFVSHDRGLAPLFDRVVSLADINLACTP